MTAYLCVIAVLFFSQACSQTSDLDHGSFANPKTGPKFRYWLEDSLVDLDILRRDVAEMAKVGSSGFELLSYQSYGGNAGTFRGPVVVDPTDVAFGSDAFVTVTKTLVQAAKDNGITIDFTLGPNQGAGAPVRPYEVNQEGMLTELDLGSHFSQPGESFGGPLPDPILIPFVVDGVIRSVNITGKTLVAVMGAQLVEGANVTDPRVSVDYNTLVDLTDQVQTSGNASTVSWSPDANTTTVILAYYHRDGIGEVLAEPGVGKYVWEDGLEFILQVLWTPEPPQQFEESHGYDVCQVIPVLHALSPGGTSFNPSTTNQTSYYGTKTNAWAFTEGYWDSLTTLFMEYMQAFDKWGESINEWGDSINKWGESINKWGESINEWGDSINEWGDSIHEWGDSIHERVDEWVESINERVDEWAESVDKWVEPIDKWVEFIDKRVESIDKWVESIDKWVESIDKWTESIDNWAKSIGPQYSNQPGYGSQFDLTASAAVTTAPKIESIPLPGVDDARQVTSDFHLGNRSTLSSETAPRFGAAVSLTMAQLLKDYRAQFAGHVNLIMIDSYVHSEAHSQKTWPGVSAFPYLVSATHGPRNPAWDHYAGYMAFLSRNQYILQTGVSKVDVALYRKGYDFTKDNAPSPFPSNSLIDAGYTYEYISPENFKIPGVSVTDGRLAAGGPAYKAIVLSRIQNITVDAAQSLVNFANDGLPIVIAGGLPSGIPGFNVDSIQVARVQELVQQLAALPNVKQVDGEVDISRALSSFDVTPAATIRPSSSSLYTIRRDVKSTSHFYLYNQGNTSINFTLTLSGTGTPFVLDTWSGEVSPVAVWNTTEHGHIVIPGVSLAATQSALFTVTSEDSFEGVLAPSVHISTADSDIFGAISASGMEIRSFTEGARQITLSNGETRTLNFSLEGETPRELTGWQLNITAWTPPTNLSQVESVLVPYPSINLTQGLVPWDKLDGHQNTSGVGTYVTTFEWAHAADSSVGVQLDFGSVVHTLKAWVNGEEIPTADPARPVVDITKFVKEGTNTIRVDAASTLLNVILATPGIQTFGQSKDRGALQVPAHYGLVDPVRLIPYARVTLEI